MFEAIVVNSQYQLENGSSLFDVWKMPLLFKSLKKKFIMRKRNRHIKDCYIQTWFLLDLKTTLSKACQSLWTTIRGFHVFMYQFFQWKLHLPNRLIPFAIANAYLDWDHMYLMLPSLLHCWGENMLILGSGDFGHTFAYGTSFKKMTSVIMGDFVFFCFLQWPLALGINHS